MCPDCVKKSKWTDANCAGYGPAVPDALRNLNAFEQSFVAKYVVSMYSPHRKPSPLLPTLTSTP